MSDEDIYKALGCKISLAEPEPDSEVSKAWSQLVSQVPESEDITGLSLRYYPIEHPSQITQNIRHPGSKTKVLYHATRTSNLWGVLTRGLALPWQVEHELGVQRRDQGRLGRGIYFAPNILYVHPAPPRPSVNLNLIP